MSKRRSFVPAAPNFAALEDRLAPTNIFGLGSRWDQMISKLGIGHHHASGNTAIIEKAWKDAAKAPHPATHPAHPAAHPAIVFK